MNLSGFILAAGFGTRMGEYTLNLPKPLLPIMGVPLIYYSLYNFYRWKIEKVYINVHYLGDMIIDRLKDYPHAELIFSKEANILGTAGGVRTAAGSEINQNIVILNPDTVLVPDLKDFPEINSLSEEDFPVDYSLLYIAEKNKDSNETGFDLIPGEKRDILSFSRTGKYFYIGYSVINTHILKDLRPLQKYELGDVWRKGNFPLYGRVFRGKYFDCGNAASYELLKDKEIHSDSSWKEFLEKCRI